MTLSPNEANLEELSAGTALTGYLARVWQSKRNPPGSIDLRGRLRIAYSDSIRSPRTKPIQAGSLVKRVQAFLERFPERTHPRVSKPRPRHVKSPNEATALSSSEFKAKNARQSDNAPARNEPIVPFCSLARRIDFHELGSFAKPRCVKPVPKACHNLLAHSMNRYPHGRVSP